MEINLVVLSIAEMGDMTNLNYLDLSNNQLLRRNTTEFFDIDIILGYQKLHFRELLKVKVSIFILA